MLLNWKDDGDGYFYYNKVSASRAYAKIRIELVIPSVLNFCWTLLSDPPNIIKL
jgi:hypothetical protein